MQFTSVLILFLLGFLTNSMPTTGNALSNQLDKREVPQKRMVARINALHNMDFGETKAVTTARPEIISFDNADNSKTKLMANAVSGTQKITVHISLINFLTVFANQGHYGTIVYQNKVEFEFDEDN